VIQAGSASPTPSPNPDRPRSQPAADLLTAVLEALPVGIGLFELGDDDVRFSGGNREFARVLGLDPRPEPGRSVGEMFVGAEHAAVLQLFNRVGRVRDSARHVAVQSGPKRTTNRIWYVDAYPVITAGRLTHLLVLAERTDEKFQVARRQQQVEADQLRQKAAELAALEKAKSEFLRLASHELRGPAAMLGGYLALMEDESLGPIPKRMRPVLPLLRAKAAQINVLANEMVEASRLEDQRLQLKRRRVDLRDVVRRCLQTARETATSKHRLHFDDRVGRKLIAFADPMRLDVIIGNLVDNAIKYSPAGGDITVQLSIAGQLGLVSVRDLGIGIAPEDMGRLFVRFSRLVPETEVPGTGLGLYLARELARLHGGDIVAVSKPGEGSEFTLSLPIERGAK
jgi:signal transduction histidine kinase